MADVGIRSAPLPAQGSTSWTAWGGAMDKTVRALATQGFYLDEFEGTDNEKLDQAIAAQKAATDRNMPAIVLPSRPISFTTPRQLYSGVKIIGHPNYSGQKNPDIQAGQLSGPEITLSGSVSSGTSSWWNGSASTGDIHDMLFANFQVQGSQGTSTHQFIDFTSGGSVYPGSLHSLSFNFMRGVLGRTDRKFLGTQVSITGDWTINNCWDTALNIGGSDWYIGPSMMNIGVTDSPAQTGDKDRWYVKFDSLETTVAGKIYISTMNGWRGVLLSGGGNSIEWFGSVIEGFKPTRINGLFAGPGPGVQVKITGGQVSFYGTKFGQGMDNPDASEAGIVQISGSTTGEPTTIVNMFGCNFYGRNMATVPAIAHTGGRLYAAGITKRMNEGAYWTGRPRIATTATAGTGPYTFANPDQSLQAL